MTSFAEEGISGISYSLMSQMNVANVFAAPPIDSHTPPSFIGNYI